MKLRSGALAFVIPLSVHVLFMRVSIGAVNFGTDSSVEDRVE